jgi:hypothetical protein
MRLFLPSLVAAAGLLGAIYFAWAWHRVSDRVLFEDASWPRPWPYPDRWLSSAERWFDARNPAAPDHIKIHGEFATVRVLNLCALAMSLMLLMAGTAVFKRRLQVRVFAAGDLRSPPSPQIRSGTDAPGPE